MSQQRASVLMEVASQLAARHAGRPLRVDIDGVCRAGKSILARDLAGAVQATGRRSSTSTPTASAMSASAATGKDATRPGATTTTPTTSSPSPNGCSSR